MDTVLASPPVAGQASPFDLDDDASYQRWRAWKLVQRPASVAALTVDVTDPRALNAAERARFVRPFARAMGRRAQSVGAVSGASESSTSTEV